MELLLALFGVYLLLLLHAWRRTPDGRLREARTVLERFRLVRTPRRPRLLETVDLKEVIARGKSR